MATKQFVSSFARLVLPFFILTMPLHARGDEFRVIETDTVRVGDDNPSTPNPRVYKFTLPAGAVGSGYLMFEARHVGGVFNEIYMNPPPFFSCQDDATDPFDDFNVGFLNPQALTTEWFTNIKPVRQDQLQPGTLCADGCAVGRCSTRPSRPGAQRCENQLVFCSRDGSGMVGRANVDDFFIRAIILHYKTTDVFAPAP